MGKLIISSFDQIEALIPVDLAWYLVYEAQLTTREKLKLTCDPEELDPCKARLYDLAFRHYLGKGISGHLFGGCTIGIADAAFEGAKSFFALRMPHTPTFQLSRYINYLEGWSLMHPDWTHERPESFEQLEIVI